METDYAELFINVLENAAEAVFEGAEGDVWRKRSAVAAAFGGWMDAKTMCHIHETHGFSVIDQVIHLRSKRIDLKVPYEILEHEFLCMGKKPSSIAAMLKELKTFDFVPVAA